MNFKFDLQLFEYVTNYNSNTVVNGSMNADSIQNAGGSNVIINAGMGDDSVDSWGSNVRLDAGLGDDYILLYTNAYNINVDAGMGDDEIYSGAQTALINAGMGDDYIHLYQESTGTTVNGGMGDDTVRNYSPSFVYVHGGAADGYDVILGYTSSSKIQIKGSYSTQRSGSDVLINVGNAQLRLVDYNGAININGTLDVPIDIPTVPTVDTDEIINCNQYSVVSGTGEDDTIENYAGGVTIRAGAGDDFIYSSTDDDYRINNRYGYVTIDGGSGDDTVSIYDPRVSINGGAGDDLITLRGDYNEITVGGGAGNDTLLNDSSTFIYEFGSSDGNDQINGFTSSSTIRITDGSYSTQRSGSDVIINVEGSQLRLVDYNGAININGTLDTLDTPTVPTVDEGLYIENSNADTLISGTNYDDTISNNADNVSVNAADGNDSIYNGSGTNITLSGGDGNDTIENDFAEYILINGGNGADSIYGNNNYATLRAGDGDDTIIGNHWRSMLNGDAGNDLISLTTYWYNTIDGGTGDDTIISDGGEHSVNGGDGNDVISLDGGSLTVSGGAGDDIIYGNSLESHLYLYNVGDGNDFIYGVGSDDTISIGGASHSTARSGNNLIINVAGGGNITVDNADVKIISDEVEPEPDPVEPGDVVTQQDVIKKFMYSLDNANTSSAVTMLDDAVNYASDSKYTGIQQVIDAMISDLRSYQSLSNGWKKFLLDKCDINLDNNDTGAISGFDAGGSTVEKTATSIVSESGNVDRSFTDNYFAVDGLNVYLARMNGNRLQNIDYYDSSLNDTERYIWQALHSWWIGGALDLISESYGDNYGFTSQASSTVNDNKIYATFYNEQSGVLAYVSSWSSNGDVTQLQLAINMHNYDSIIENDPDGNRSEDGFYLDRVLAHEFTHAVMGANIKYFHSLPMFITEGMAELTHGTDDDRGDEITTLAMNPDSLLKALNINTLNSYYDCYAGGYMFLRYIAKQFSSDAESSYAMISSPAMSSSSLPDGVSISNDVLLVSTDFEGNSIDLSNYADITWVDITALAGNIIVYGSTGSDVIRGSRGANKIFAGAGADTIEGGDGADKIYGGDDDDAVVGNAGDDTIYGGSGRNTLTGGAGADVFVHDDGADWIIDYIVGEDRIKLLNGLIRTSSVDGDDVVLRTSSGLITVTGGANNELTIVDKDDNATVRVFGDETFVEEPDEITSDNWTEFDGVTLNKSGTTMKVSTPFSGTIDAANFSSKLKKVDASKDVNAVEVIGNDNKNTFKAGSGGSTLDGGGGNDKLYGGDGIDVFIFDGRGKDKIYNYSAGDRIVLTEEITKVKVSGKKIVLTSGDGTLTINKAAGMTMTITDADGETNTYIFDKKHKTLEDALENANGQLPSDYWFIDEVSAIESPLEEIISVDNAVDFNYNDFYFGGHDYDQGMLYLRRHGRDEKGFAFSRSDWHRR